MFLKPNRHLETDDYAPKVVFAEQQLLAAVLCRALQDLCRIVPTNDEREAHRRDAYRWVMYADRGVISFHSVCEELAIDPVKTKGIALKIYAAVPVIYCVGREPLADVLNTIHLKCGNGARSPRLSVRRGTSRVKSYPKPHVNDAIYGAHR